MSSHVFHIVAITTCLLAFATSADAARLAVRVFQSSGAPPTATATLTVTVSRSNGSPVHGAEVCLTFNNQGFIRLSDTQGRTVIPNVPQGNFRLLVGESGFRVTDQQITMGTTNQERSVTLIEGSPSAFPGDVVCRPPGGAGIPTIVQPIKVTNFQVNGVNLDTTTSRTVFLGATFDRAPGYYRAGETRDLSSEAWQPFTFAAPMTYRLNLVDERGVNFGLRNVYFQVAPGPNNASVSNLVTAPVILAPAQTSRRVLTGAELEQFLSRARDAGYSFTMAVTERQLFEGTQKISFSKDCPPGMERLLMTDGLRFDRVNQKNEFRVFSGPLLNAFWKILDVEVSAPTSNQSNVSIGVTGISTPVMQGMQQPPLRRITIQAGIEVRTPRATTADLRTLFPVLYFLFPGGPSCVESPRDFFEIKLNTPTITSLTIEGPDNIGARNALPPRN